MAKTKLEKEGSAANKFKNVILKLGKSELKNKSYLVFLFFVFSVLFLIGISPLLLHVLQPDFDIALTKRSGLVGIQGNSNEDALFYLLGYRPLVVDGAITETLIGPFGLGATVLSLLIPLAFGLGIGYYYRLRSKNLIKIRQDAKKLENEFASALFQLGK